MKDYTSSAPEFSETIRITETTDPAHADIINAAPKQLLENTLVLHAALNGYSLRIVDERPSEQEAGVIYFVRKAGS